MTPERAARRIAYGCLIVFCATMLVIACWVGGVLAGLWH